jgi:hypothetical protein
MQNSWVYGTWIWEEFQNEGIAKGRVIYWKARQERRREKNSVCAVCSVQCAVTCATHSPYRMYADGNRQQQEMQSNFVKKLVDTTDYPVQ